VPCFNIHAESLQISPGHMFHPIEIKLGLLPILVIQNLEKYKKIRIKSLKIGFLLVPQHRGELR
jgi:hypothetical protein